MSQLLIFYMCMLNFEELHAAGNKNKLPVEKWMSMNESVT